MKTEFTRKELCELMEEFADRAHFFNGITSVLPEAQATYARAAKDVYRECAKRVATLGTS